MCGIIAFAGEKPDAPALAEALRLVRHRGQDGLGVWHCRSTEGGSAAIHLRQTRNSDPDVAAHLPSAGQQIFVAHWRYATRGGSRIEDVHPIVIDGGDTAIAHNGQFQLWGNSRGRPLSDTQLFSTRVENEKSPRLGDRIFAALDRVAGAFALVAADRFGLTTARDRFGIRPLFWGRHRGGVAFSSEMPALTRLGCGEIEEIAPGSVIDWTADGPGAKRSLPAAARSSCSFESIYFHSGEGSLHGHSVAATRHRIGRRLARECPADGEVVVPVPKSGMNFALGFAEELGIPFEHGIVLRPEASRTFIEEAANRANAIDGKYRLQGDVLAGRSVVVVDDSLVRGATMQHIARALRAAGAREVHARIGSPRFTNPCFFGIDVPDRSELICAGRSLREVRTMLGLDSLGFLSIAGLHAVLGEEICTGCFSGRYPEGALLGQAEGQILLSGETAVHQEEPRPAALGLRPATM